MNSTGDFSIIYIYICDRPALYVRTVMLYVLLILRVHRSPTMLSIQPGICDVCMQGVNGWASSLFSLISVWLVCYVHGSHVAPCKLPHLHIYIYISPERILILVVEASCNVLVHLLLANFYRKCSGY